MAPNIKIGERVVGRIWGAMGRYGTRQVVGEFYSAYPDIIVRDKDGKFHICSKIQRVKP